MGSYALGENPLPSRPQRARVFTRNTLTMLGTNHCPGREKGPGRLRKGQELRPGGRRKQIILI